MNSPVIKKISLVILIVSASSLISACSFHAGGNHKKASSDTIEEITEIAKQTCGGARNVEEVTLKGFSCRK